MSYIRVPSMPAEANTKRLEPLYTLPQQSQVEIVIIIFRPRKPGTLQRNFGRKLDIAVRIKTRDLTCGREIEQSQYRTSFNVAHHRKNRIIMRIPSSDPCFRSERGIVAHLTNALQTVPHLLLQRARLLALGAFSQLKGLRCRLRESSTRSGSSLYSQPLSCTISSPQLSMGKPRRNDMAECIIRSRFIEMSSSGLSCVISARSTPHRLAVVPQLRASFDASS